MGGYVRSCSNDEVKRMRSSLKAWGRGGLIGSLPTFFSLSLGYS